MSDKGCYQSYWLGVVSVCESETKLPTTLLMVCCVLRIAMAKVTKSVRLPIDVAEQLEEQDNQSVTVEKALRERFDMEEA